MFYADRIIDHGPRAVIVSWFVGKLDVVGFKLWQIWTESFNKRCYFVGYKFWLVPMAAAAVDVCCEPFDRMVSGLC